MALNPMYFQVLSPQQANPLGYGMQQGAQTAGLMQDARLKAIQAAMANAQLPYAGQMAQQDLQTKQLANALSQNTLNYAPQMSAADLAVKQAQPGLFQSEAQKNNAQAALMGTQNNLYPYQIAGNLDPVSKMILGNMLVRRMNGNLSVQPQLSSSNNGMTVQPANSAQTQPTTIPYRLPESYPTLPGGLTQSQGQQVAQGLPNGPSANISPNGGSPTNMNDLYSLQLRNTIAQMGKDPTMGSLKSGAGGTYYDPFTGKTMSSDTPANTTMDQQTAASIQRITPLLQSLSKNLSPFQNAWGQGKLRTEQAWNFLTPDSYTKASLPNVYATGQADLKTAPESLIRAFGLRVTNEALDRMQAAVEPQFGETAAAYQGRILNELNTLKSYQQQAQGRLKSGMNVDSPPSSVSMPAQMASTSKVLNGTTYHKINGQWYAQ